MVLETRHIYFTDNLFFNDVLHLNIPYPQFWKVLTLFMLLFLLPFTFNKSPLDKHIPHIIYNLLSTILSITTPARFLQTYHRFIRMFNKQVLLAIIIFITKCYVSYVGVKVENEGLVFNQPVIHRAVIKPWEKQCKILNGTAERRYITWEVDHCSKIKHTRGYHKTFYVPSVTTADRSEQRCLPHHKSSAVGRIEFRKSPPADKYPRIENAVSGVWASCKHMGVNCDFINRWSDSEGSTWIGLDEGWSDIRQSWNWMRFEHTKGGEVLSQVVRHAAILARQGSDEVEIARTALAVNQAVRYSRCFKKSHSVDTIKVPNLVIHLIPLLLLFVLERVCRQYLEHLVDTTPEEGLDEHLKVVMEEALS